MRARLCYLDVDGVVADLHGALARLHGLPVKDWPPGEDDLARIFAKPIEQVWSPACGDRFWRDLPILPWARELVWLACSLFGFDSVCFVTQPTRDPGSLTGKVAWIHEQFPGSPWILTPDKATVAGPGRLLVDDREPVERAWRARGGECVLLPARWNRLHRDVGGVFEHVARGIRVALVD